MKKKPIDKQKKIANLKKRISLLQVEMVNLSRTSDNEVVKVITATGSELSRQLDIYHAQIYQVLGRKSKLFYALMDGLEVYCQMENGVIPPKDVLDNEELRVFCIGQGMNLKGYLLLRLSGVERGDDLLEKEESIVSRKWAKAKEFV